MAKPTFRTRSIGTKVTDEEYEQLVALAGERSLSEWVRDVLLGATRSGEAGALPGALVAAPLETSRGTSLEDAPGIPDDVLLGEVLGLRTVVLNVVYALGKGETLTPERMQQIIERADAEKLQKATERRRAARCER